MDVTAIIDAFFQSAGPWAALAVLLLIIQWDAAKRDERSIRHTLELLTKTLGDIVEDFRTHDARLERMNEALMTMMAARKERA